MLYVKLFKIIFISVPVLAAVSTLIVKMSTSNLKQFYWKPGFWGECSEMCEGQKSRKVLCFDTQSENYVGDQFCEAVSAKPAILTNCSHQGCAHWDFGSWAECSVFCQRERRVACRDAKGIFRNDCSPTSKPHEIESCCNFEWDFAWEKCKRGSVYFRKSVCKRIYPKWTKLRHPSENGTVVDDNFCGNVIIQHRSMFCVDEDLPAVR